ncbi:MAG: 3-isopropylmalate dehydrogenase [Deltaproteobacteria bacterium]|jgi:3-isopropylmalate dehydrogenase|nr:3-isopropylmalate dehydrogenase [Deltaproteobacteria bacterium]
MKASIVLLPGDGIGPEIVAATRRVLDKVAQVFGHDLSFGEELIGGAAIDDSGKALPEQTLSACKDADAVLLGAVGGPKWDDPNAKVRPEQGLLAIRKGLGLFANLRPVKAVPALYDASPLKNERLEGVDILVVRELTGGLYFGKRGREKTEDGERAFDTLVYTDAEIRRVVRLACKIAQGRDKRVTSVDKANVLDSSRLWRQVATEVDGEFADVTMDHQLVDAAAMRLITSAKDFDVIVTENMFGDILTDEASVLTGSLGMLASASLGDGSLGLYEPIHGSAPDIAGQGVANPLGTVLSAAMLLRHSLGLDKEAAAIEKAAFDAVDAGKRTRDLGGDLNTAQMTEVLVAAIG